MGAGEHVDFVAHANEGAHVRRRMYVGENVGMRAHVCHAVCLRELRAHDRAHVRVHAWVLVPRRVSGREQGLRPSSGGGAHTPESSLSSCVCVCLCRVLLGGLWHHPTYESHH